MKVIKSILICTIFCFVSCGEASYETVTLDPIYLSDETLDFFSFYENTEELKFYKLSNDTEGLGKSSTINTSKELTPETPVNIEYWTFNKVAPQEIIFEETENDDFINNIIYLCDKEERTIKFADSRSNTIKINASIWAPRLRKGERKPLCELLKISYDDPCGSIYLEYKPIDNRDEDHSNWKYETTIKEELTVGPHTYNNVMQLIKPTSDHYIFYATKKEGIIAIVDLHTDETWALVQ
jgi:hypothetical protein